MCLARVSLVDSVDQLLSLLNNRIGFEGLENDTFLDIQPPLIYTPNINILRGLN